MPMQITVVNQNVNSIRSISSDADVGSQGTSTATTDASDSREDAVDRDADDRAPAHRGEPTRNAVPETTLQTFVT